MKILFLGTSSGWPLPRLGCHCKICTSKNPQDKRLRPSILINDSILIDAGPDIYHQLARYRRYAIRHTLITHIHPDHYFGLWDVGHLMASKPTIWLSAANLKAIIKRINDLTITFLLKKAKNFKHGEAIKINTLQITPFLVDHSAKTETYGFKIKEQVKTLVVIPDFRAVPSPSRKYVRGANLAIFDGSNLFPAGPKRWGHMAISESIPLAKKLKIKQVYYTHIGHGPKMKPHQQLEEFVQKHGGKNFHLAYDSLELTI